MNTLIATNILFPFIKKKYIGKVREVYHLDNNKIIIITTDRMSAFDIIMPKGIPYKGQVLNQISVKMMRSVENIVPHWIEHLPDPNVVIGKKCTPFKIEMVIRGYLSGHAARQYKNGERLLCGEKMPHGLKENDPFPTPIITPATKVTMGHDEDISKNEIIKQKIVSEEDYIKIENYTRKLFKKGTEIAQEKGLILVDTKYEFGKDADGKIRLIDEIHTPDSSRYFYKNSYEYIQRKGKPQKQLSKEFLRQWLIRNDFQGLKGQKIPFLSESFIKNISQRYIELYEKIMGTAFEKSNIENIENRIEKNLEKYFS